ncbi:hypothetical protein IF2G_04957 [Cordyceps javanica]|nr:hypothetical protein IF2G_04957 [Cordyceps javanica]
MRKSRQGIRSPDFSRCRCVTRQQWAGKLARKAGKDDDTDTAGKGSCQPDFAVFGAADHPHCWQEAVRSTQNGGRGD